MLFDDRLATVLRSQTLSETAARTQYRQLLDLLGSLRADARGELVDAAFERLAELASELPAAVQSQILRALDLRLRNPALVDWLARGEPQAAAAAMATARLAERDWLQLIPRLPVTARGFLRHRRDLPLSVRQVLERLGVKDLVLPEPAGHVRAPAPPPASVAAEEPGIGALVKRIEAFQRARREAPDPVERAPRAPAERFDFASDARGEIVWAEPGVAPLTVGMTLAEVGSSAQLDATSAAALRRQLPLIAGRAKLSGPAAIAGDWLIDAAPAFDPNTGAYTGHRGRMRRVPEPLPAEPAPEHPADRMRQVLHELRTPVNAIQGFAEIIQQQLFGPAPHEYRALAGAVAVDAARLMAAFDELDRLARLESGALALEDGASDLREVTAQLLRRLEGALRPRSARMELAVSGSPFAIGIDEAEAQRLAWRILASLAGALAPGEIVELTLSADSEQVTLRCELPASLSADADVFAATTPAQARAVSAGMFGSGFALRLARAEAHAAGGQLERDGDTLVLRLPALTGESAAHSVASKG